MKILIVEDDGNKLYALRQFIHDKYPEVDVEEARSLIGGVRKTRHWKPDVVLLDMTLPSYDQSPTDDGGDMEPFGGLEYLSQMERFGLEPSVLVLTQFETFGEGPTLKTRDQLGADLDERFSATYCGMLHYHASLDEWTNKLADFLDVFASDGRMP